MVLNGGNWHAQSKMLDAAFEVAPRVIEDGRFQNIANMLYGMANLNRKVPEPLLKHMAEAALLRMPTATPHVSPSSSY